MQAPLGKRGSTSCPISMGQHHRQDDARHEKQGGQRSQPTKNHFESRLRAFRRRGRARPGAAQGSRRFMGDCGAATGAATGLGRDERQAHGTGNGYPAARFGGRRGRFNGGSRCVGKGALPARFLECGAFAGTFAFQWRGGNSSRALPCGLRGGDHARTRRAHGGGAIERQHNLVAARARHEMEPHLGFAAAAQPHHRAAFRTAGLVAVFPPVEFEDEPAPASAAT